MNSDIKKILTGVKNGEISVDDALLKLKIAPFEDIGYAKVDLHRQAHQGAAEVIYGAGKTPEQIIGIIDVMKKAGQGRILITRLSREAAKEVSVVYKFDYRKDAKIGVFGDISLSRNN